MPTVNQPRMRIAAQPPVDASAADIAFVNQLGVEDVVLSVDAEHANYDYYVALKKRYNDAGIKIYALGNHGIHCNSSLVLNLADRDEVLERYKQHIRDIGRAGIPYVTHAHIGNGVWYTDYPGTRGGAETRLFDLAAESHGQSPDGLHYGPLSHGRAFGDDEIWDNYEHFIRQIAPVAEEWNVKIGVHPDDPPVAELAGIPRCFYSFDSYKRALQIADSPNVGVCLCVGCWLEGGAAMGEDVFGAIRYFAEQKKLFKVHFRNVDRPLPVFTETFVDDGYMDMYKVMLALREADFDGVVIPDHVPAMEGGDNVGMAYTIGYMKALLERANAEVARSAVG